MTGRRFKFPVVSRSTLYAPVLVRSASLEERWRQDDSFLSHWYGDARNSWFNRRGDGSRGEFVGPLASMSEEGVVGFTNGRHRTRWLLQLQLDAIPVCIPFDEVDRWREVGLLASVEAPVFFEFMEREMKIFDDGERGYLREMRALTTDSHGREVLVGLNLEESAEYMALANGSDLSYEAKERYLHLHDLHDRARMEVLAAENQLRVDKPPRH